MLGDVQHRIWVSALEAPSCPRMPTLKGREEGFQPGPHFWSWTRISETR